MTHAEYIDIAYGFAGVLLLALTVQTVVAWKRSRT